MAGILPPTGDCCLEDHCTEPQSVAVPGPQGPAGADGTNGTDGENAYTTASLFVMPAEQANVTVTVGNSDWMVVGQNVAASAGGAFGEFEVIAKPTSVSATLKNLENTATGEYTANSAPGTNFPNGTLIGPGGRQGPSGSTPAGALLSANNLNDVANSATSRTNLGLGTMAVQNASAVAITGGSITGITDLAIADGGTGQSTQTAAMNALSPTTTKGDILVDNGSDVIRLAVGSEGQVLKARNAAASGVAWQDSAFSYALIQDQQPSGTDGGTFTNGAWRTRVLNTTVQDADSIVVSLASNQVELGLGSYILIGCGQGSQCDGHRMRLQNVTDATTLAEGPNADANSGGGADSSMANVSSRFVVTSGTKLIELQHRCATTRATDGFGRACTFGTNERYAQLEIYKVA